MKTKVFPTLILTALILATTITEISAQISGQVINFHFNRYNSASNGSKVTVHDGENLGTIQWKGWTPGNEYQASAGFGVDVTGTPIAGYLPSRLNFYTGGSGLLERMTILENGRIGIGLSNPAELVDINGNVIVRGTRLSLGLGSAFGNGGEALTHSNTDCAGAPLPDEVLTLNNGGGFQGGVYVEGPGGLHVCATMVAECLNAENNVVSENGNIVALGGTAGPVPCTPGDGDFIAAGPNGDFITRHGEVVADEGNITATLGNVSAGANVTAGSDVTATNNIVAVNGNVIAQTGSIESQSGNVVANQNVMAMNGNVSAFQNVSAQIGGVTANLDVVSNNGHIRATNGDLRAGADLLVNGVARIGSISGDPTGHALAVGGSIISTEVKVELQGNWPDYVFSPSYALTPLSEVKAFVKENQHLPGIPSAAEVQQNGQQLGETQRLLLEKVEELYLHLIQTNERMEILEKENAELRKLVGGKK